MEQMTRCPTHPGVVFRVTILEEHGISVTRAAKALGLSRTTMSNFCHGHTPCTVEIAQRIALSIDSNVAVWINLQAHYDAWLAEHAEKPVVEKLLEPAA
ncbi:HigA family addiction module antitoxin [Rheinheimera sp.]|uniref:HigA family addiction module antitoxin n=1 Tax=Rheinheimera sp. TaxID=1869214 RepID=UPI00307EA803